MKETGKKLAANVFVALGGTVATMVAASLLLQTNNFFIGFLLIIGGLLLFPFMILRALLEAFNEWFDGR
jgi:hypothetical protein